MSGIWPFFNNSLSNANINDILTEIELDQQKRFQLRNQQQLQQQLQQQKIKKQDVNTNNNGNDVDTNSKIRNSPASPSSGLPYPHSIPKQYSPLSTVTTTSVPTNPNSDSKNSAETSSSLNIPILAPKASPMIAPSPNVMNVNDQFSTTSSLSPEVAYSPTTRQFNITASQLLQSIQQNDTNLSQSLTSDSPIHSHSPVTPINATIENQLNNDKDENDSIAAATISKSTLINISLFNKLLDQPNLLDEINLSKNQKLINYVSQNDVISTMIHYILFSLKLSKFSNKHDIPQNYFDHDIFENIPSMSPNHSNDEIDADLGNNENEGNLPSEVHVDKLEIALQRATIISEIFILPNTNIVQNLLNSFDILIKFWRGILDKDPEYFFKEFKLISSPEDEEEEEEAEEEEEKSNHLNNGESCPDEISLHSTDSQKMMELEESKSYGLRESHEIIVFNNFLKLIDDIATFNMNGLMNFIRFEQENQTISSQFLKYIPYSQTTCDLLVRLISTDKPYNSNGLIDILIDQNLILDILKLSRKFYLDHQVQDNICNLLNGIVGISSNIGFWEDPSIANGTNQLNEFGEQVDQDQIAKSNNPNIGPNDLTRQLVSNQCVLEMLDIIINYGNYGLVTVVSVIIEVIRKNNSDYDEFDWIGSIEENADKKNKNDDNENNHVKDDNKDVNDDKNDNDSDNENFRDSQHLPSCRDPIYLGTMLKLFSIHLKDIVINYLTEEYYNIKNIKNLNCSIGSEIEPLGYERFKIMELIAELLHCSNMILMNKSSKLDNLIYQRDLWRDVKKTESLVNDALNEVINDNLEDSTFLNKSIEKFSLNNDADDKFSFSSSNGEFIELSIDLSIGNYFKYELLQTNAIPLITLKLIKFPWNNFMHNVVFDLIQQVFNGRLANWDEDRAANQEETKYDDHLSLNKILIWSLFGDFDDFNVDSQNYVQDPAYPGFFNLPQLILYSFNLSSVAESKSNFKLGYMGHLTLIAEEVHKFQSYVENFGLTRHETAFGLVKDEKDSEKEYYLKSSYFIFNILYERVFESDRFKPWLEFVNGKLKDVNSMYNKVLGNPNEIGNFEDGENEVPIEPTPLAEGAILLDNGDNEEFHHGDESGSGSENESDSNDDDIEVINGIGFSGGDLRPMSYENYDDYNDDNTNNKNNDTNEHELEHAEEERGRRTKK